MLIKIITKYWEAEKKHKNSMMKKIQNDWQLISSAKPKTNAEKNIHFFLPWVICQDLVEPKKNWSSCNIVKISQPQPEDTSKSSISDVLLFFCQDPKRDFKTNEDYKNLICTFYSGWSVAHAYKPSLCTSIQEAYTYSWPVKNMHVYIVCILRLSDYI